MKFEAIDSFKISFDFDFLFLFWKANMIIFLLICYDLTQIKLSDNSIETMLLSLQARALLNNVNFRNVASQLLLACSSKCLKCSSIKVPTNI